MTVVNTLLFFGCLAAAAGLVWWSLRLVREHGDFGCEITRGDGSKSSYGYLFASGTPLSFRVLSVCLLLLLAIVVATGWSVVELLLLLLSS